MRRSIGYLLGLLTLVPAGIGAQTTPNILIVLIDDLGVDQVGYDFQGSAITPNLANLAASGMVFENAWAYPYCSPTRAAIHTGRHPLRQGIGEPLGLDQAELRLDEFTLPELVAATHTTGIFGKWHLGIYDDHPGDTGWDHYEVHHPYNQGGGWDYFEQTWTVNGVNEVRQEYMTESTVTSAIDWIETQTGPWLAMVAPLSVHQPVHCPPREFHSYKKCSPGGEVTEFLAMVETLDTLLQPLFDAVDLAETTVFVLSDNGTDSEAWVLPPYVSQRVKGTIFQGGVNVPFFATGSGVVQGVSTSLVGVTDLFETIAALTESTHEVSEIDSVDISPILADPSAEVRDMLFSETFSPNHCTFPDHDKFQLAARDRRYKLLIGPSGSPAFFDLEVDPLEMENLLTGSLDQTEQQALDDLITYVQGLKTLPLE